MKIADFDYVGFSGSRHGAPPAIVEAALYKMFEGSGTWGTIALAVGLGLPTMLWLPDGIQPPDWNGRFDRMSNNWWLSLAF